MPTAVLQLTFDGLRRQQIPRDWVAAGGGLEAYVFDGRGLATADQWQVFGANLRYAKSLDPALLTGHFPTDHADWVNDDHAFDQLRRFCWLAVEHGVAGVTVHANQFVSCQDWPRFDLTGARERTTARLAQLDEELADAPLWIGVENLPLVGSQGIDYDPVFVRPADFRPLTELESTRIGVTWDVCHWAITHTLDRAMANLRGEVMPDSPADPPTGLRHLHFGSFAGVALPFVPGECTEGVPPQVGTMDQELLAALVTTAVTTAATTADPVGIVCEIQEEDYVHRRACWQTLDWLRAVASRHGWQIHGRLGADDDRPGPLAALAPPLTGSTAAAPAPPADGSSSAGDELPYSRPHWDRAELDAVGAALRSGVWTNGARVAEFEDALGQLTGAGAVSLANGTAAIFAVLQVLGSASPDPKLLVTPTINFAAGAASARLLGWEVGLCDVREDDLTLCPDQLDELLARVAHRYARVVVLPVHYAGHPCDLARITKVCRRYGADLVEDACHAPGATYPDGTPVGSWPDSVAACFSFHPTKPVAAAEGGAVASTDPTLLARVRSLRNHHMTPVDAPADPRSWWPYDIPSPGLNLRLSELHAAVGTVQVARATETRAHRRRLARRYYQALAELPAVRPVPRQHVAGSAHHLFPVVVDVAALGVRREDVVSFLRRRGIRCQLHYPPLHQLAAFRDGDPALRTSMDVAERLVPGLLSIPLWYGMTDSDQDRVIAALTDLPRLAASGGPPPATEGNDECRVR